MVALVTRGLLLLQLLVASGIALALLMTGRIQHPWMALTLGLSVILLLRMMITANSFFWAWRFGSETPAAHRLNLCAACRLFLREFMASMLSSSFTMPFRTFTRHEALPSPALPVLLVHGYLCNSGYWHSMSKALRRASITHRAIDMEPITASIEDYAASVHHAINALCRETRNSSIVIVAHSMGGLAVRAGIRAYGREHIARVITLGTPHGGTKEAQFGMGENCVQMHCHADGTPSDWLQALAASEDAQTRALFISIYSHQDNIVAPQTSSHFLSTTNIELHGIGHVALALDAEVQSLVVAEIYKASKLSASATTTSIS
jgi:triacylglycerol esterase/lipase EstA (alpha/beta hydrolase family)